MVLLATLTVRKRGSTGPRTIRHEAGQHAREQADRTKQEATADQQKENKPDRTLAKEVQPAIVADKTLSTYAHNVKVIAEHGTVTLKGPVRSQRNERR